MKKTFTGWCMGWLTALAAGMFPACGAREAAGFFVAAPQDGEGEMAPLPGRAGGRTVAAYTHSLGSDDGCLDDWQTMETVVVIGYMVDEDNTMALPRGAVNDDYNIFVQAWAADGDTEITPSGVRWEIDLGDFVTWETVEGDATLIAPYATADCFDGRDRRARGSHGNDHSVEPAATLLGCIVGPCNSCGEAECLGGWQWLCGEPIIIFGVANLEGDWWIEGGAIVEPFVARATQHGRHIDWDPPETTFTVYGDRLYATGEMRHYDAQIAPDRQSFSGTVWAGGELDRYGAYIGTWTGHKQ